LLQVKMLHVIIPIGQIKTVRIYRPYFSLLPYSNPSHVLHVNRKITKPLQTMKGVITFLFN